MKTIGDQQLIKRINRSVLLRLVRAQPGLSRAQLAAESGLTKSTVSLLVRELIDENWMNEARIAAASGMGRPSTPLQIDTRVRGLVGVEVAVEALRVVVVSLAGQVLWSHEEELTGTSVEVVCAQTTHMVVLANAQLVARSVRLSGVGVCLPGAIDEVTGVVHFAPNLGWRDVYFLPQLRHSFLLAGIPDVAVHLQNDADAAAVSEYEFSENDANDSLIFVTCGTGVGAGIVLNDRLFTGLQGMAGEIGHSILQIDGPQCSCGRRGCAEAFFGSRALSKLIDPNEGGQYLGVVLHNLWTSFSPSVLVVGGPTCDKYPKIVQVAEAALGAYADCADMAAPKVRRARYGLLASAVGAAALVLHHFLRPLHTQTSHGTVAAAMASAACV